MIGHHQWTHAAEREAAVAFQNAVLRIPKKIDYRAMPWATYCDPEVATVGRTHGFDPSEAVRVFRAEYDDLDRARIEGRTLGFAKVATTPSGKILGATVVGDHAALVLQEFVFAMEHGLTLHHIVNTVHPYPTHAGLARALANQFAATRLESGLTRAALQLVYGYEPRHDGRKARRSRRPSRPARTATANERRGDPIRCASPPCSARALILIGRGRPAVAQPVSEATIRGRPAVGRADHARLRRARSPTSRASRTRSSTIG